MSQARLSACMLIPHKGHTDTIQVYSVTVMTHVKALQAGHSSQGTSEPITTGQLEIQTGEPEYERSTQTRSGSVSAAVKPDPAIRTGGGVRTDDMNFDTINGQSESCTVSPSSDSGCTV